MWLCVCKETQTRMIKMKAAAYDNRTERKAMILDTARPFVAVKPIGHFKPVIGHYATMKAAKAASKRWNESQEQKT